MTDAHERTLGWAMRLPRAAAAEACALRLVAGIEVAETADALWLRGRGDDEGLKQRLKTLPADGRFVWRTDGRLRPEASLLATETLPELPWAPIRAWARVEPPPARLPAGLPARAGLRLAPAHSGAASNALLLDFGVWRDWALAAPVARLERLVFAVSDVVAGLVLARGRPTPAAPGRYLVETDGVLVPAGLACEPAVSATVIRRVFGAGEGDVLLWDEAGARVLGRELFVPATRAAVRESARALERERGGRAEPEARA